MSKETRKSLIVFLIAAVALVLISFLPPETGDMTRASWKYLGCFAFMLITMIGRAFPDWACVLATMGLIVALGAGKVATVTASFASSTLWLVIGVFIMSIGINNSGIMKRIALWVLVKFPGTYIAQVAAMLLAGLITTPMIPSAFAKTSIMAPFTAQVSEALDLKPNSKPALGLWYANFVCTYSLGNAFLSGSAFVALMIGYIGSTFTWGEWFSTTWVWYLVNIALVFIFCAFFCKPKNASEAGNVEFLKEQYKNLGPVSLKEKQAAAAAAEEQKQKDALITEIKKLKPDYDATDKTLEQLQADLAALQAAQNTGDEGETGTPSDPSNPSPTTP